MPVPNGDVAMKWPALRRPPVTRRYIRVGALGLMPVEATSTGWRSVATQFTNQTRGSVPPRPMRKR